MEFRTLKANEIDVKVGNVTSKGYTLLLYKNARTDMAILDETVGAENWQNKFYEVCGNLYCSLGINIRYNTGIMEGETLKQYLDRNLNNPYNIVEPYWIWKDDCGVESAFGDKEKGQASDARKRAGFAWGIGRELYTSPFIFISAETRAKEVNGKNVGYEIVGDEKYRKFEVAEIEYNENREISKLIIKDNKENIAFIYGQKSELKPKQEVIVGKGYIFNSGLYKGKTIAEVIEIDHEYIDKLLKSEKVNKTIKENIQKALQEA